MERRNESGEICWLEANVGSESEKDRCLWQIKQCGGHLSRKKYFREVPGKTRKKVPLFEDAVLKGSSDYFERATETL